MRRSSVSSPFNTTQALNALSVGPVLRVKGSSVLVMKSSVPHTAPASTRPCPSIILVALYAVTSAPNSIGRCSAGVAKALSTTLVMPRARAMPQIALRSAMSIVGLAGVSKKNTLVLALAASSNACGSRASTTVVSMPNLGSSVSTSQRHDPNAARPATTWSPVWSWHSNTAVIAAMPVAIVRHASAPSSKAIRASSISTVGFCSRE
ncbi:hypothetical protein D9M73_102330 [compost metagenome]